MKTKHIQRLALWALSLLLLLSACSAVEPESSSVEPAALYQAPTISVTGVIVPAQFATLSVAAPGLVHQVLVWEGQVVSQGEQLLQLSGLALAKAGLAAAELELEAAQQALAEIHENAGLQGSAAWLAHLEARAQALAAEADWELLDTQAYQDEIDAAQQDVVETGQDLEDAQETFDRYTNLADDNPLRTRYEDELTDAREINQEALRSYDGLVIALERAEAAWHLASEQVVQTRADYDATRSGADPDQLALAEARLAHALAQVAAAQAQIDNLTLLAPFAGTVSALNIRPGEWASPGQPVLILADLGTLQIETTDLNEIDIVRIDLGDQATVSFDALPDRLFAATVTEISPKAAPGSGVNYTVTLTLDELPAEIRWGMTVFVDFDLGK